MILCVGLAADETFLHTVAALRSAGAAIDVLDLVQVALSARCTFAIGNPQKSGISIYGRHHPFEHYRAAWIRLLDVSEAAPSTALGGRAEAVFHAFSAALDALPIRVVNPPGRHAGNFAKLFHTSNLATILGCLTPRSCLTNEPDVAREFIASCAGDVIYKGASARKTWVSRFAHADEARLERIADTPVLFQERIDGPDVRVHVVGDRAFGELIESRDVDYRRVKGNRYQPCDLPAGIATACGNLTRICGTPFMGVDFKIDRTTGEWFFLEANTMPCYQGYDRRAGGAISNALVDFLADRC